MSTTRTGHFRIGFRQIPWAEWQKDIGTFISPVPSGDRAVAVEPSPVLTDAFTPDAPVADLDTTCADQSYNSLSRRRLTCCSGKAWRCVTASVQSGKSLRGALPSNATRPCG